MTISKSEGETQEIAKKIAKRVEKGGIVCLFGEIGTGKTTFTKGLAQYFGIEKFSVKSPTYTFIRKYSKNEQNLYHIDLYRLEIIDDLLAREIDELTENKSNIIIIEWADKMKNQLPEKRIEITFEYLEERTRKITINYL